MDIIIKATKSYIENDKKVYRPVKITYDDYEKAYSKWEHNMSLLKNKAFATALKEAYYFNYFYWGEICDLIVGLASDRIVNSISLRSLMIALLENLDEGEFCGVLQCGYESEVA